MNARERLSQAVLGVARAPHDAEQKVKKNYAEALSRALAQLFADELRDRFPGIQPGRTWS